MNSTPEAALDGPGAAAKLSHIQKLAGLLLMLSPENAAQIMKQLDEEDLEAVSGEMAKFTTLGQDVQVEILREFSGVVVEAAAAVPGGVKRAQSLLEQSVGLLKASDIICRVSPMRAPVAAMEQIVEMDARQLFNLLRHEQLQTVALVASYLPQEKAALLLALMRPELREQVIDRLATLAPTSIEVVENVAESLREKISSNRTRVLNQTGGIKVAAQVLNAMPKDMSKSILIALKEHNSDLAQAVSKKMFTFEELERLDARTLQTVLQAIDMRTLTVSLKTASEKLKNTLLAGISKNAAASVREEISFMGPVKLSEIDAARTSIIERVRELESEGEIDLQESRPSARN